MGTCLLGSKTYRPDPTLLDGFYTGVRTNILPVSPVSVSPFIQQTQISRPKCQSASSVSRGNLASW